MNSWTIYEHTSPSGKVYVGITSLPVNVRWQHGAGYPRCKLFYKAILKYGWDNLTHTIIASNLGEKTAKNMEKDLIAYYKRKGISYNITKGWDGVLGVPKTKEDIERVRNIWKGKKIPQEIRNKMSKSRKGVKLSPSHIENIRASKLGNKNGNKALVMIKNDVVVAEYESCVAAAKALGTHPNCISRCCRKENKTWHGYILEYVDK